MQSYRDPRSLCRLVQGFFDSPEAELTLVHDSADELFCLAGGCFRIIEAGGGLVKNPREEYLVIRRRGVWDLPKGKADKAEKPDQAALREVTEECGLENLELLDPLVVTHHTYMLKEKPVLKNTHWYMMYSPGFKTIPETREDITEARWFRKDELGVVFEDCYPSVREVFIAAGLV